MGRVPAYHDRGPEFQHHLNLLRFFPVTLAPGDSIPLTSTRACIHRDIHKNIHNLKSLLKIQFFFFLRFGYNMGDCVWCVHGGQGDIRVARVQQVGFPLASLFPLAHVSIGPALCRPGLTFFFVPYSLCSVTISKVPLILSLQNPSILWEKLATYLDQI